MKKYKITWYAGYMDLDPIAQIDILKTMEVEADSINKVNPVQILPKSEQVAYATEIEYCLRTMWHSGDIEDAKQTVSDYGSHSKFIYVEEVNASDKIFETYPKIAELISKSGRDIDSATLKLVEELGEFTSANFGLKSYKKNTPEDVQEEIVDLLQCAMGLYSLIQEKYPFDGKAIMDEKLAKWEKKYLENNSRTPTQEEKEAFWEEK